MIKAFLPKETRDYIPKYIAAQYILQNHRDLGLRPESPELDLLWTGTVLLNNQMSITEIAEMLSISNEIIIALNPSLKRQYIPQFSQGYDLVLPKRVLPTFQYFLDTSEKPGVSFAYRTVEMMVEQRSSIFELAGSLKVDPYLLKAWNQLTNDFIDAGDRIVIHELYDPSQVFRQTIVPMPFTNLKEKVNELPAAIDYRRILYDLVAKQRVKQDEARNWSMHTR
jgi:membrane-bound lytic murein transglycosylase D